MPDEETLTKGERTHRAVMDAAYRLFMEQGFHATSMRQIADRAGLALGGIYNHFASKEEVFGAVMAERHPFHQIIPLLATTEGATVEDFVHNAARRMVDELVHHPDFFNLMLIEVIEFKGQHMPKLFEALFPQLMEIAQRFAQAEGKVRPIPPLLLMRAFLGMFFSYYVTQILIGDLMPPEIQGSALDTFAEIFLHGVLENDG
ncbi:MAG: TetR/AcrR family transcriptional regulator [Anaerolineales bacterium]|nr:TetR/AcrR family transcriptional regulator [Anaerolineales bacterium]